MCRISLVLALLIMLPTFLAEQKQRDSDWIPTFLQESTIKEATEGGLTKKNFPFMSDSIEGYPNWCDEKQGSKFVRKSLNAKKLISLKGFVIDLDQDWGKEGFNVKGITFEDHDGNKWYFEGKKIKSILFFPSIRSKNLKTIRDDFVRDWYEARDKYVQLYELNSKFEEIIAELLENPGLKSEVTKILERKNAEYEKKKLETQTKKQLEGPQGSKETSVTWAVKKDLLFLPSENNRLYNLNIQFWEKTSKTHALGKFFNEPNDEPVFAEWIIDFETKELCNGPLFFVIFNAPAHNEKDPSFVSVSIFGIGELLAKKHQKAFMFSGFDYQKWGRPKWFAIALFDKTNRIFLESNKEGKWWENLPQHHLGLIHLKAGALNPETRSFKNYNTPVSEEWKKALLKDFTFYQR